MRTWRSWFLSVSVVVVPAALWVGCGDSTGGTTTGTLGGACYANSTCNAGLDCVSNQCVASSDAATLDSGSSVPSIDSGGDTTDAGTGADSGDRDASNVNPDASSDAARFDGSFADCGTLPTLHDAGPGPFCPLQQLMDGGPEFASCAANEQCCYYQGVAPTPASTCNANGVACAPQATYITIDWACDVAGHCPANDVCCMYGKDAGTTNVVADNTCPTGALLRALNVGGSRCAAACAAGEVKLCATTADCPMGTTCTAFSTNAKVLGICK